MSIDKIVRVGKFSEFRITNQLTWKMAKKMRKASTIRATMYEKAANVKAMMKLFSSSQYLKFLSFSLLSIFSHGNKISLQSTDSVVECNR